MNHMSRMFSRWIDMSLSSEEQEGGEGGGGGGRRPGGPLGPGLARARRRIDERRRQREEQSRLDGDAGFRGDGSEERERQNSSSSSDSSFNLFGDDREQEMDGSGESRATSTANSSSAEPAQREAITSAVDNEKEVKDREVGFDLGPARSSGEPTTNLPTGKTSNTSYEKATPANENSLDTRTRDECATGTDSSAHLDSPNGSTPSSEGSAVLVESRSLALGSRRVPRINIIEDETDSDDVDRGRDAERVADTTDSESNAGDPHVSTADDRADPDAGIKGYFGDVKAEAAVDCIKPFKIYKGHRNVRTMVCSFNCQR